MPRPEPEYTAIAKGLQAEIGSAVIQSRVLNILLRSLLFVAGFLALVLAYLILFPR